MEPDYGCEEQSDDYIPLDKVILKDENGQEIEMDISDKELYQKDINEEILHRPVVWGRPDSTGLLLFMLCDNYSFKQNIDCLSEKIYNLSDEGWPLCEKNIRLK